MNVQEFKRKLAAILSADVEGYSRHMGEDEEATIRTLTAYREAMAVLIQQYRGRVVDDPGDNLLAEFASVVDAVDCAVAIQQQLSELNSSLPAERKMQFRIGVNLGDVVEEGDRIYGDGVNIAARIEGLATGGGICISRTTYGQVKNRLNLGYEYLGGHKVKNIAEPVRVYLDCQDSIFFINLRPVLIGLLNSFFRVFKEITALARSQIKFSINNLEYLGICIDNLPVRKAACTETTELRGIAFRVRK